MSITYYSNLEKYFTRAGRQKPRTDRAFNLADESYLSPNDMLLIEVDRHE